MSKPFEKFAPLDIEWLFNAEWNYKETDEDMMAKLVKNLRINDQVENIIVRQVGQRYEVVNGNHRLNAMKQLGFTRAMCYNLGEISDAKAHRIAIETNETKFIANGYELAKLLKGLTDDFDITELCSTLPYTEGEVNNHLDLLTQDFNNYEQEPPNGGGNGMEELTIYYSTEDAEILGEIEGIINKYPSASID